MPGLLIVEDEEVLARNLVKLFARSGIESSHATGLGAAKRMLSAAPVDVVLLDLRLPDGSGLDLLDSLIAADPDLPVIMMTAYGSVADAVDAMQRGARDYVQKPFELDEIQLKVERPCRRARERREISYYRERRAAAGPILGESAVARALRELVARIARMTAGPGRAGADRAAARRDRQRQGPRGPRAARRRRPARRPVHRGELHGAAGEPRRIGAVRLREGRVHRCQDGARRPLRNRRGRHALSRRDRPHLAGAAGEVPEGHRREDRAPRRRQCAEAHRRADHRRDQSRSRGRRAPRRVPRGSLPAAVGGRHPHSAAARARRRRRCGSPDAARRRLSALRYAAADAVAGGRGGDRRLCLAGKRARARQHHGACRALLRQRSRRSRRTSASAGQRRPPAASAVAPSGDVEIDFPDGGLSLEAVERALLVRALEKAGGNQSAAARLLGISRDTLRYRMEKFALGEKGADE